jgi:DNA-binding NarL/FixJ family response regulator
MSLRIVVADDHSLFRDGVVSLLEAAGHHVIAQVGDGESAVREASRGRPDLVLLDISMPGQDGLETLRQIRKAQPSLPVVMLTVSDSEASLFEALRAGAQGYLLKSLEAGEFLALIEGIGRGEAALTRQTATRVVVGLARGESGTVQPSDRLTERELQLLGLVARGLSNKAIARELSISENTVKYYMKNILQKLGAQNRTEAATYALRSGLVSIDPP